MQHILKAGVLLILIGLGAPVSPAAAQLLNVPMADLPDNQELLVVEVELAPGQASNPHRHNDHEAVYVLEGVVHMQVAGGELMTLSPGEMFYETPQDIHAVSANASDTEPAKILVHIIKTVGTPVTTLVPN